MTADPPTPRDLAAGRELDKRVAEAIGWTFAHTEDEYDPRTPGSLTLVGVTPDKHRLAVVPAYSTDMGAAWQIVEQWREQTLSLRLDVAWVVGGGKPWRVEVWLPEMSDSAVAMADTAPLAICKAALAAIQESH